VKLPRDWIELIESLCSNRVRFIVVGAHALAVHGRPRATGDLDIFVEPTKENARRLGRALAAGLRPPRRGGTTKRSPVRAKSRKKAIRRR
jgi:hypothetical protein